MDRGAWQATVLGIAELDTTERLILLPLFTKPATWLTDYGITYPIEISLRCTG